MLETEEKNKNQCHVNVTVANIEDWELQKESLLKKNEQLEEKVLYLQGNK